MLTTKKEKEIISFAKNKVNALRELLESQDIQKKYTELSGDNVEIGWEKFRLNIDKFTLDHFETKAELLTIPLKTGLKNLNLFKLAIEEICTENKLGLYVIDAFHTEESEERLDEKSENYCLRLCSPSLNRNLQTLRLMTYIEEEKIDSLIDKVNHAKDKSLQKNVGNLKQLLHLGVEIMVDLSYSWYQVKGIISAIEDNKIEIMISCTPEVMTISNIQIEDPWQINSIEFETPIKHMWHNEVEFQKRVG